MLLAYMRSSGTGVASPKYIETRLRVPFAAVDAKAKGKTSGLPLASTVISNFSVPSRSAMASGSARAPILTAMARRVASLRRPTEDEHASPRPSAELGSHGAPPVRNVVGDAGNGERIDTIGHLDEHVIGERHVHALGERSAELRPG